MCGFTGIYAFNELGRFFQINLSKANEVLKHRGPDDAYLFTEGRMGLGHRRLSVIDVSSDGRQPMSDSTGRYTLVFNGEIYNFKELKSKYLEGGRIDFKSSSDTEVLLYLLIMQGVNCLEKLNGCFAFAFYDQQEETLLVVRDRYGIKPLYYYQDEDKLLFASELNSLLQYGIEKSLNYQALFQYFQLNYIPATHTIFEHCFKLLPGHYLEIKQKEVSVTAYYTLPQNEFSPMPSYQDAGKAFMELLEQAVHRRLIADVPLGAFLSGGVDSSTIVALAAKQVKHLNTFSVGYRDEPFFDETKYAELVANMHGTEHTVFKLSNDDLFEYLTEILSFYGEPFADASAIPTYILSKKTRQKVTVALSGDGGDELLAGYNKHTGEWLARNKGLKASLVKSAMPILKALPKNRNAAFSNKIRQLHRFGSLLDLSPQERYWQLASWRNQQETQSIFSQSTQEKIDVAAFEQWKVNMLHSIEGKNFNEVLRADFHLLLPNDMLHKVDSMSMAHGLEVRVPFLDHQVVDYVFQLTDSYKIKGNFKKKLLQDFAKPILPKALYKRSKKGFDVPLMKAYRSVLKDWIENTLLHDGFIEEQGIFNKEYIRTLRQVIQTGNNFDQNQVWGLLCFQQWWQSHMV